MQVTKEEPLRVLHITEMLSAAGIESFIMNIYRRIDRGVVQFDFLVLRNQTEFYDEEISNLGGKKYFVHSNKNNPLFRVLDESKQIEKFLKNHPYDIVHIHYTTPLRAPYLLAAKRAGTKVRIFHSHSAEISGKNKGKLVIYNYYRKKIEKWATNYFACSEKAAHWMFPKSLLDIKKYNVIYNGIDIERFKFNKTDRLAIRKELGLDGKYVIVHTGRFLEQKNHRFIVEVFKDIYKKFSDVKLLLLGTGYLVEKIKNLVSQYGLDNDVFFMGVRSDVNRILSAADCYFMPSLYEGLPVAAVEAECSGLPCVLSENITPEVALTENVTFLSLNDSVDKWSDTVLSYQGLERKDCSDLITKNGYNIKDGASALQRFYQESIK